MPNQLWDAIFWIVLIITINICIKDLMKWFFLYWTEDDADKRIKKAKK